MRTVCCLLPSDHSKTPDACPRNTALAPHRYTSADAFERGGWRVWTSPCQSHETGAWRWKERCGPCRRVGPAAGRRLTERTECAPPKGARRNSTGTTAILTATSTHQPRSGGFEVSSLRSTSPADRAFLGYCAAQDVMGRLAIEPRAVDRESEHEDRERATGNGQ